MAGINIDPLAPLRALLFCAIALVIGLIAGGVPAYFIGHSRGAASHLEAVGSLKTSVASCTKAATASNALVERERTLADERDRRLDAAIAENARIAASASGARSRALTVQPRGNTECERTSNMIADQFRAGGKP